MAENNELGKEVVAFEAQGLDEMIASVEDARKAILKQYDAAVAANSAMKDPAIRQRVAETRQLEHTTGELIKREKERADFLRRQGRLLGGQYVRDRRETGALAYNSGRLAVGERSAALRSGLYLREREQAGRLGLQERRLGLQERHAALSRGLFLKEHAQTGQLAHDTGQAAVKEREAVLTSGVFGKVAALEGKLRADIARVENMERAALLHSGQYLRNRTETGRQTYESNRLGVQERQTVLNSGVYGEEIKRTALLARAETRLANAERMMRLTSGHFAESVKFQESQKHEERRMAHAERKTELQVQHGRLLGAGLYGLERARPAMLAAGTVGGIGMGMARSGLQGTVEGHSLAMEMHLLNREIAGALLPVVKDLTSALRWVRHKLEGLSGGQQDVLGYGIAGAAGLGGLGLAVNGITKAMGGLASLGRGLGVMGAATPAAGSMIAETALGVGTAAAAASRLGTGAATASRGARFARFARGAGPLAIGAAVIGGLANMEPHDKSFYKLLRGSGRSKLNSAFQSSIMSLAEFVGGGDISESFGLGGFGDVRRRMAGQRVRDMPDSPHRNALIADAGFESFDQTYERVANATAIQAAAESAPGGRLAPARTETTILEDILTLLREHPPTPPPLT